MQRQKLSSSVLSLAREKGLSVIDDAEVVVFSSLGGGLTLAKWMYSEGGSIRIDLVLRRSNDDEREVGGVETLSWDGINPDKDQDGVPDGPLSEDDALAVIRRWGDLRRFEGTLDAEHMLATETIAAAFLARLRESSKH